MPLRALLKGTSLSAYSFDHFCEYMLNTIGLRNRRSFLISIIMLTYTVTFIIYTVRVVLSFSLVVY
jgi:hypothetical protein